MNKEKLLKAADRWFHKPSGPIPFSNGTEAMEWTSRNCERCVKSITSRIPEYKYPEDAGEVVLSGRDCVGNYAIGMGFIVGHVAPEIVYWMNGTIRKQSNAVTIADLPADCPWFSDNDRDNPDNENPEPDDPNQLLLPFSILDLFGFDDPDIIVTKKAILEARNRTEPRTFNSLDFLDKP